MDKPAVYADYQKTDDEGRLILACQGTARDMREHNLTLAEGLALTFYMDDADDLGRPDDLLVDGIVEYDRAAGRWVATINRDTFRHRSEMHS